MPPSSQKLTNLTPRDLRVDFSEQLPDRAKQPDHADLILVFPASTANHEVLPTNPARGSAQWYTEHIVSDSSIFTAETPIVGNRKSQIFTSEVHPDAGLYPELVEAYSTAAASKTMGELRENIFALILNFVASRYCCLKAKVFASADGEEILVHLSVSEQVLRAHADLMNYELQLSTSMANKLLGGRFSQDDLVPAYIPYDLQEEMKFFEMMSRSNPEDVTLKSPFQRYFGIYSREAGGSIFRGLDRIKITQAVLKKHLDIDGLVEMGFLNSMYCCHGKVRQTDLCKKWCSFRHMFSFSVPLNTIADYFGEKVGFRVCFIEFLVQFLVPLALVGPFYYVMPDRTSAMSLVGVLVSLWSAFLTQFWTRRESKWLTIWGMERFEYSEVVRPQFIGKRETSPVDRATFVKVYPAHKAFLRTFVAQSLTLMCNLFLIVVIVAMFKWRSHCVTTGQHHMIKNIVIITAVQMQVFNAVWTNLAFKLTDFENHETDTSYAEAVAIRIFVFRFINSFAPLFYIAFFKHFVEGGCEPYDSCELELASQLRSSFGVSVVCSLVFPLLAYVQFKITIWWHARKATQKRGHSYGSLLNKGPCYIELQKDLVEYSLYEEISDDIEYIMGLGFILFFGFVAPELFALCLFDNLVRLRTLGYKMVVGMRRAFPHSAAGIGILNNMISIMCYFSLMSNIVEVIMINAQRPGEEDIFFSLKELLVLEPKIDVPRYADWRAMLIIFFMLERAAVLATLAVRYFIPDIPMPVQLARKRREVMIAAYSDLILGTGEGGELKLVYDGLKAGDLSVQTLQSSTVNRGMSWQPMEIAKLVELSRPSSSVDGLASAGPRIAGWNPEDPGFEESFDFSDNGAEHADLGADDV